MMFGLNNYSELYWVISLICLKCLNPRFGLFYDGWDQFEFLNYVSVLKKNKTMFRQSW